jgi:hypothetical protein
MMTIPLAFSSRTTFLTARLACHSDFAPVHTIFPELKISVAVFGFFSLKTRPGNCSGQYSTLANVLTTVFRSMCCPRVADATTFSMLIIDLTRGILLNTFERPVFYRETSLFFVRASRVFF